MTEPKTYRGADICVFSAMPRAEALSQPESVRRCVEAYAAAYWPFKCRDGVHLARQPWREPGWLTGTTYEPVISLGVPLDCIFTYCVLAERPKG